MKSQKERVYEYIEEFGSINTLEAFKDLGVTRLSAVIFELRKLYDIADEWIYGTNRWGEPVKYKKYFINEE